MRYLREINYSESVLIGDVSCMRRNYYSCLTETILLVVNSFGFCRQTVFYKLLRNECVYFKYYCCVDIHGLNNFHTSEDRK